MDGSEGAARTANQALFREINERLLDLNVSFEAILPLSEFVCECRTLACVEKIAMTLGEYAAVRIHPSRFAVMASDEHVYREVESVVAEYERYWVVQPLSRGLSR